MGCATEYRKRSQIKLVFRQSGSPVRTVRPSRKSAMDSIRNLWCGRMYLGKINMTMKTNMNQHQLTSTKYFERNMIWTETETSAVASKERSEPWEPLATQWKPIWKSFFFRFRRLPVCKDLQKVQCTHCKALNGLIPCHLVLRSSPVFKTQGPVWLSRRVLKRATAPNVQSAIHGIAKPELRAWWKVRNVRRVSWLGFGSAMPCYSAQAPKQPPSATLPFQKARHGTLVTLVSVASILFGCKRSQLLMQVVMIQNFQKTILQLTPNHPIFGHPI